MPHGSVSTIIPASSAEVFRLLHDYDRRLEWDTLLQSATLTEGWTKAQLHATSVCQGRWYLGGVALKTEYLSFKPPEVAAVKMVNRPPFFQSFAATIRHRDLIDGYRIPLQLHRPSTVFAVDTSSDHGEGPAVRNSKTPRGAPQLL